MALTPRQCESLVRDTRGRVEAGDAPSGESPPWDALLEVCRAIEP